jgi:hypothetical protein
LVMDRDRVCKEANAWIGKNIPFGVIEVLRIPEIATGNTPPAYAPMRRAKQLGVNIFGNELPDTGHKLPSEHAANPA